MNPTLVALALSLVLSRDATTPTPAPTPTGPVYFGNPAARMDVDARALGIDADGAARWLVVARFLDSDGNVTRIMANSDLEYDATHGHVQWQTRMRYGQPSAIVSTTDDGPIAMTIHANVPHLNDISVRTDTRRWSGARVVAVALGPRTVQLGWFPREQQPVTIERITGDGTRRTIRVTAPSSSFRDTSVLPGKHYRYIVGRADKPSVTLATVVTPSDPPQTTLAQLRGKGMWLFFSTNPIDDTYYAKLHPQAIVDQAVSSGLQYVELRTAYGAYWEIPSDAKPTVDAIVDGLAAHGIATIAWTVPRDTSFEDLSASVRSAYYHTANGTRIGGLAVDLERGADFMGGDTHGTAALGLYVQRLREALGPSYLLVSTVEDPYLEHLDANAYPYRAIARYSSVLQPMAYWRMMRRTPTNAAQVATLMRASYARTIYLAGRRLPVSMGGETSPDDRFGPPSAGEIAASLATSRSLGALGECFFDWNDTQPEQWQALAAFHW